MRGEKPENIILYASTHFSMLYQQRLSLFVMGGRAAPTYRHLRKKGAAFVRHRKVAAVRGGVNKSSIPPAWYRRPAQPLNIPRVTYFLSEAESAVSASA